MIHLENYDPNALIGRRIVDIQTAETGSVDPGDIEVRVYLDDGHIIVGQFYSIWKKEDQ